MAREPWVEKLEQGAAESAWDLLIDHYHRLIAATVRHYGDGYDEVMDLFAYVCESLRSNDFARLRKYAAIPEGRVRFSTWLVAVIRNLLIDWFRHRHGRKRLDQVVAALPPIQREAFQRVFVEGNPHVEAYELTRTMGGEALTFPQFLRALTEAQRTVTAKRPGQLLKELAPAAATNHRRVSAGNPASEPVAAGDQPDTELMSSETREWLREALETLPTEERVALQLYVLEGLSAADVARLVGWDSAKTVYNHVYRSLSAVRRFLLDRGIGPSDLA